MPERKLSKKTLAEQSVGSMRSLCPAESKYGASKTRPKRSRDPTPHRSGTGDLLTNSSDFSIRISPVISPSDVRET